MEFLAGDQWVITSHVRAVESATGCPCSSFARASVQTLPTPLPDRSRLPSGYPAAAPSLKGV